MSWAPLYIISKNCTGFNFVQWSCVFLISILSGRQITKKNQAIFANRLSGLCFLWDFLGKILRHRDVIVKTVATSSQTGAVEMFQKQKKKLSEQILQTVFGEILLLKTADLNFEGNKFFSSNYFCSDMERFVTMHTTANHPWRVVTLNEMFPFIVPYDFVVFFAWFYKDAHVLFC